MRRAALLLAVLCTAACSVDGSGETAADGETPAETCSRVATVICQKLLECYSAEERDAAMLPASMAECQTQIEGDLECATQTADNQCDEGESYDPATAEDCVVEYEGLTCDVVRAGIEDSDTPSCAHVCQ